MQNQIKHLSVILVEMLRFESEKYNKPSKTLNQSKNHIELLLNQCLSVAKWITTKYAKFWFNINFDSDTESNG